MSENIDPITQELLEQAGDLLDDGEAEYQEAYGIGRWPDATLQEVQVHELTQYGFKIGFKLNLKGDSAPYTGRVDLPFTPTSNGEEPPDYLIKRNDKKKEVLNRLLASAGFKKTVSRNIDNAEDYEHLVAIFRAAEGQAFPVEVRADGKSVKEGDKWTFVPNGFTRLDGLRPKKRKA